MEESGVVKVFNHEWTRMNTNGIAIEVVISDGLFSTVFTLTADLCLRLLFLPYSCSFVSIRGSKKKSMTNGKEGK